MEGIDDETYRENPSAILAYVKVCPVCNSSHVVRNGSYPRPIQVRGQILPSVIFRKLCRNPVCAVSLTLLPAFILPRHRYARTMIAAWLVEWLAGSPCRNPAFLQEQGVRLPVEDPLMSKSDFRDAVPTRPSYQLMWRWSRFFSGKAAQLLGYLMSLSALNRTAWPDLRLRNHVHRCGRELALAVQLVQQRSDTPCLPPSEAMELLLTIIVPSHGILRDTGSSVLYGKNWPVRAGPTD